MSQALLVMDLQPAVVARIEQPETLLHNIQQTTEAARKASIQVIYVTVAFREGFPEVSGNNKMFGHLKSMQAPASSAGSVLHPSLQMQKGDLLVEKRRVSAFTGSDLEVILRAKQISHLVLCGIATSGVVLSTLREAADKDFSITVLEDCCIDFDKEVHEVLTRKVFVRQAEVMPSAKWLETLNR